MEKWGVLGQEQIEGLLFRKEMEPAKRLELFFNGALAGRHHRSSYKVLKRLEAAGLVVLHWFANVSLYSLTGRGHAFLRQRQMAMLPGYRCSISPALVPHEVLANGVGLTLEALLGLRVSTEFARYVRSRNAKDGAPLRGFRLPDLWISDGGFPKAVEVERTLKDFERYEDLWSTYRSGMPRQTVVLYIAAWPNGANDLLAKARKLLMDFIYVCHIDDFMKSLGTCPFVDYRGGTFRLEPRDGRPQEPRNQPAAPAGIPTRQDASAGGLPPVAAFAPPSRSGGIGTLIRPAGGPDQSAAPPAARPFPHPQPRTPSPAPEGADRYRWPNAGGYNGGDFR
ncbi:MAG: PadR family transcriptional regulator [Elusimicrobia bacterium]|nr:PadR family transcriptional regulator [Elusimicrobiota bacterium]